MRKALPGLGQAAGLLLQMLSAHAGLQASPDRKPKESTPKLEDGKAASAGEAGPRAQLHPKAEPQQQETSQGPRKAAAISSLPSADSALKGDIDWASIKVHSFSSSCAVQAAWS